MKHGISKKIACAGSKIQGTSQQPLFPLKNFACLWLLVLTGKNAASFVHQTLTSVKKKEKQTKACNDNKCGALRDLVAFVQFKKREKHP